MFEKEAEEYLKKDGTKAEQILDMLNEISPLKITLKQVPFILAMIQQVFKDGAEFGYNTAFVEADKNLKAIVTDFNKANEWHRADIPTSQINKVVLGYIKDYNSKMFCLVKWNGEWWYDARTYNERVKLIAWKEIVLPKESE